MAARMSVMRKMPQRILLLELKAAIDTAIRTNKWDRVDVLVSDNAQAMESSHIRHNLGARRRTWLADRARRGA